MDLKAVAAANGTSVVVDPVVSGRARLLPTRGGFVVYVSRVDLGLALPDSYGWQFWGSSLARTLLAHELVHTLFYDRAADPPQRLFPNSQREEAFCYDATRFLLAPHWLISDLGLDRAAPPVAFQRLTSQLRLGMLTAARVMLADHELATGVAGEWVRVGDTWRLRPGRSAASGSLPRRAREALTGQVREYLGGHGQGALAIVDRRLGNNRFVIATIPNGSFESTPSPGQEGWGA